jgi:hypothetical protein
MYYLRTKPAATAIKFTVDKQYEMTPHTVAEPVMATTATSVSSVTSTQAPAANDFTDEPSVSDQLSCSLDNPDGCLMCGS